MIYEDCFCGRIGPMSEREPVYLGGLKWGLRCRICGDVDNLEWLEGDSRSGLLRAANGGVDPRPPFLKEPEFVSGV